MKSLTVLFSCMLLCCNAVLATLTGSDDFNDGMIDTGQWDIPLYIGNAGLSETNGHLHFHTLDDPGTSAYQALLPWKVLGPFTQDWEVQVSTVIPDFALSAGQEQACGLTLSPNEIGEVVSNRLTHTLAKDHLAGKQYFQNLTVNGGEVLDYDADRTSDTALLRMRWTAATSNLYSDISTDGGTTWTSYWPVVTNPFNMTDSDGFVCMVYGASEGRPITISDNLYLDDFQATIYSGALNGSDDFNDNARDTSKWLDVQPLLTETNNRLEFTTSGIGDENGAWVWIENTGSCTQDWSVTIDAYNSSISSNQWSLTALGVLSPNASEGPLLIVGISNEGETDRGIIAGWEESMSEHYVWHSTTYHAAKLNVSYDARTKKLSSSYDLGNGFIALTNRNISGLTPGTNDSFMIVLGGSTENDFLIESGEMYFDNFEAATLPGISNHLYEVEIDQSLEYRNPSTSADDTYDFWIGILTDTTVSNVLAQCPGGASLSITNSSPDEDNLYWDYGEGSLTPFFSQFGDGDYIVSLLYTNGTSQATAIPYAQNDGTTPIPAIAGQPTFTTPAPLHGALFTSSQPDSLTWTNIDPNANVVEIERLNTPWDDAELIGLYSDLTVWEPTGPLSTRSVDSLGFTATNWIINIGASYEAWGTNSAGVEYSCAKGTDVDYAFTVLNPDDDFDSDGLPNWWEAEFFDGPTNAVASLDSDHDSHKNLQEYITGMVPTNAASVFRITNSMPLADDFLIEWPSVSGRVYSTYWTTNLMNSFQSLETGIEFPINSCTDIIHNAEDKCFYRVDVQMQ